MRALSTCPRPGRTHARQRGLGRDWTTATLERPFGPRHQFSRSRSSGSIRSSRASLQTVGAVPAGRDAELCHRRLGVTQRQFCVMDPTAICCASSRSWCESSLRPAHRASHRRGRGRPVACASRPSARCADDHIPPRQSRAVITWCPASRAVRTRARCVLHQICHSAIHARFSEAELARHLHDIEALRAIPKSPSSSPGSRTSPPPSTRRPG